MTSGGKSLVPKAVALPAVTETTLPAVEALVNALGLPREILASDQDITTAWGQLPGLLAVIPPQLRDPLLARMCVAVSVGLLDAAIAVILGLTMFLQTRKREFI